METGHASAASPECVGGRDKINIRLVPMGGRKAVVFAVNNPFTAALNPNHGTPNSAGISARVVRFRRTRGGHDSTQGRRSESEKTEIDSESCGVHCNLASLVTIIVTMVYYSNALL